MWNLALLLTIASAAPIYKNELRHLPEKLKQERIQETIQNTFNLIQHQIIQAAIRNETDTHFTLFCLEPNMMQKKTNLFHNQQGSINLFRRQGSTYSLLDQEEYDYQLNQNLRTIPELIKLPIKPRCSVKDGYELYNRHFQFTPINGPFTQPQPNDPLYVPLDFTAHSKPGIYQNLEQEPILYVQQFFQLLNQKFPDVSLVLSHERKSEESEGIFETDCCPVYTVSW